MNILDETSFDNCLVGERPSTRPELDIVIDAAGPSATARCTAFAESSAEGTIVEHDGM